MLNKFMVTTSINSPTRAMMEYVKRKEWKIIMVGDLKTPHEEYRKLEKEYPNLYYMHPDTQNLKYKELSEAIGWNRIMRRNLGFCEAYARGADIIYSTDDDNILYENWGENIYVGQEIIAHCWKSENGVFDPLSVTNVNYLWHRGYPSELINSKNNIKYMGKIKRKVLVQADLWDGVPDIDAMARIIYKPRVKLNFDAPFCSTDIAPFNSQNTFIHRSVIPYYMVLPHAGRMDDIWASYIVQKIFPDSVIFGQPTVYQERHEPHHRNMKDLKDETLGYEYTLKFINGEFPLPEDTQKAYDLYKKFFVDYEEKEKNNFLNTII